MKNVLIKIQQELKVPKGQYNDFAEFKYRSCEDILEAVKPLLKKYNALLLLTDELVFAGNRYYIKATATLSGEGKDISVSALAREQESKKKYDESQITGASSSYARKYALNGLFAIDDTKDADTQDNSEIPAPKPANAPAPKPAPQQNTTLSAEEKAKINACTGIDELGLLCSQLKAKHPQNYAELIKLYNAKVKDLQLKENAKKVSKK